MTLMRIQYCLILPDLLFRSLSDGYVHSTGDDYTDTDPRPPIRKVTKHHVADAGRHNNLCISVGRQQRCRCKLKGFNDQEMAERGYSADACHQQHIRRTRRDPHEWHHRGHDDNPEQCSVTQGNERWGAARQFAC